MCIIWTFHWISYPKRLISNSVVLLLSHPTASKTVMNVSLMMIFRCRGSRGSYYFQVPKLKGLFFQNTSCFVALYMVIVQVSIRDWTENLNPWLLVLVSSGHGLSVSLVSQKRHSNKHLGKIWYMWLSSYCSGGLWQRCKQDLIVQRDAQLPDHEASFLVSLLLPALHASHLLKTEWRWGGCCPSQLQLPFPHDVAFIHHQ